MIFFLTENVVGAMIYLILFEGSVASSRDNRFQPAPQFLSSIYKRGREVFVILQDG